MRDKARRAGWLFLTILFLVTGVGIGIYAFWQGTHPPKDQTAQSSQTCSSQTPVPASTLPIPEAYQPQGAVSKLIKTDIVKGTGKSAQIGDCLQVKYHGALASTGVVFEQNFDQPLSFQFTLGQGYVIPGWDQGLAGMQAGGIRRLLIPADLAYGPQASDKIPANSDLVFTVKLLSIK